MTATATAREVHAKRKLIFTRTFDAPRALVFSMWTEAKHVAQWWGPHSFTNPVCEIDARPGGKILIHMQGPDGTPHPMGGLFHEVVPNERLVFTSFVDMPDGQRVLESLNTVTFQEKAGKTTITVTADASGYADFTKGMLSGMEAGWVTSIDKLANRLAQARGRDDAGDLEAIHAIFGDRTNAIFGKVVDYAVKHVADDIVSYDLDPPLQHVGINKTASKAWFETWEWPISWVVHDLQVAVSGDVAHAHGLGHMVGTKTDGQQVDLWTRCTTCFKRIGGVWKITNDHTSVPFHMDGSMKAAVDLKPQ